MRATQPMHGRTSAIHHEQRGLFAGLPSPLAGCRYHSLVIEPASLPAELEVTAATADGTIMAIEHREQPLFGLQFHPESILTEHGFSLLAAFVRRCGLSVAEPLPGIDLERREPNVRETMLPAGPVTF